MSAATASKVAFVTGLTGSSSSDVAALLAWSAVSSVACVTSRCGVVTPPSVSLQLLCAVWQPLTADVCAKLTKRHMNTAVLEAVTLPVVLLLCVTALADWIRSTSVPLLLLLALVGLRGALRQCSSRRQCVTSSAVLLSPSDSRGATADRDAAHRAVSTFRGLLMLLTWVLAVLAAVDNVLMSCRCR
jgi:hypothetical protein